MKEIEQILVDFLGKWQNTTCKTSVVVEEFVPKILEAAKKEIAKNSLEAIREEYPDGTFIYSTKNLINDDMESRGIKDMNKVKLIIINDD